MRVAVETDDLYGYAEHDVKFHKAFSRLPGTSFVAGVGNLWRLTYESEFPSAKCPRSSLKLLSRTSRSSMRSKVAEQGKPASCCVTTSRLLQST